MTPEDYERERQRLEEQLQADIQLLQAAHQARLKALEAVWRASHPPAEEAPRSPRRARGGNWELDDAVDDALERLPREFTSKDLRRELGFSPNRSSLHRALRRLEEDGALKVLQFGTGRRPALYRKTERSNGSPG